MKLYLDDLLPDDVERILYLDSDILVTDDLTELWNIDLKGHCAAGVIDCLGEKYYELLGLNKDAFYCNSGMILEDLKAWKQKRIGDKVRKYCEENGGYVFSWNRQHSMQLYREISLFLILNTICIA